MAEPTTLAGIGAAVVFLVAKDLLLRRKQNGNDKTCVYHKETIGSVKEVKDDMKSIREDLQEIKICVAVLKERSDKNHTKYE